MKVQAMALLVGVLLAVEVGLMLQAGLGRLLKRRNRLLAGGELTLGMEYALGLAWGALLGLLLVYTFGLAEGGAAPGSSGGSG